MVLKNHHCCPTKIHTREGFLETLSKLVEGRSWVLVTSAGWKNRGVDELIFRQLGNPMAVVDNIPANPTVSVIENLSNTPKGEVIVALGGGSVMDAAKGLVVAQELKNDLTILSRHLANGEALPNDISVADIICIPTTSGTGSEVTRWGTIWGDDKIKYSITDPVLYPSHAILDPSLCLSMPKELTLASGLDAVSHSMEAIWNVNHTPLSDEFSRSALTILKSYLRNAIQTPDDLEARRNVQIAATLAGFSMGTTQTALCHSISYPFTSNFKMPHGLACSFTLPIVAEYNLKAPENRLKPISDALDCTTPDRIPDALLSWFAQLEISDYLKKYISPGDIEGLKGNLITRSRASNNICPIDGDTAKVLVRKSLQALLGW